MLKANRVTFTQLIRYHVHVHLLREHIDKQHSSRSDNEKRL